MRSLFGSAVDCLMPVLQLLQLLMLYHRNHFFSCSSAST